MHEFSMAEKAFEMALSHAKENNTKKINEIHLLIGDLTMLSCEQIIFWLNELTTGTIAENAKVLISHAKNLIKCRSCGYEGSISAKTSATNHYSLPSFSCPACNSADIDIISGLEFYLEKLICNR